MSDQNVVTDWKAYFAALGPGRPMSPEQLEAMRDKNPTVHLIVDDNPGGLMNDIDLSFEDCFAEAQSIWEAKGKPAMWLQLGRGTAPWFVNAVVSAPVKKGRGR